MRITLTRINSHGFFPLPSPFYLSQKYRGLPPSCLVCWLTCLLVRFLASLFLLISCLFIIFPHGRLLRRQSISQDCSGAAYLRPIFLRGTDVVKKTYYGLRYHLLYATITDYIYFVQFPARLYPFFLFLFSFVESYLSTTRKKKMGE